LSLFCNSSILLSSLFGANANFSGHIEQAKRGPQDRAQRGSPLVASADMTYFRQLAPKEAAYARARASHASDFNQPGD
ncbi:MAG TPA: hypothetical protein PL112_25245, partial [Candidatus Obscuribacter sp.]|nr:hypothetical protein [Candidatus Obscuribacter sp.]